MVRALAPELRGTQFDISVPQQASQSRVGLGKSQRGRGGGHT